MSISRRTFIESGVIVLAASVSPIAPAAPGSMLSESDPTAAALGYKSSASAVDKKKFPQYVVGQACSNCSLYLGTPGSTAGPCTIYAGKSVSSAGWCASYVKKA